MPDLILKSSGKTVFVTPEGLGDAIASGLYEAPRGEQSVPVEIRPGLVGETTIAELETAQARGAAPESERTFRARERDVRLEREHGGVIDKGITFAENALNEATLGLTGAVGEAIGGDDYTERRLERAEANPGSAIAGKLTGVVATTVGTGGTGAAAKIARYTPLGAATRIGARAAHTAEGAGFAAKATRAAFGGAVEGGIVGVGHGVQQLTDSDDPLTWERAMSTIGTSFLSGATSGAVVGVGGKVVEKGLSRARRALDEVSQAGIGGAARAMPDDLVKLDRAGLRAAEKAEIDAIEAARVPKRAELADEIKSLRSEMKEQKIWLATKDADVKAIKEVREIGKVALEADKSIDRMLRNPKALTERPQRVLDGLQQQEHALERLVAQGDNLKPIFAKDTSGARQAAFDYAATALDKNRALQAKIGELTSKPTSARLGAITDAADALVSGGVKKSLPQQLLEGSVFGNVTALAAPLGPLAPMIGAKASSAIGRLVFGKMPTAANAAAQRTARAVETFLDVSTKAAPAGKVIATKVLSSVAFAPSKAPAQDVDARGGSRAKAPAPRSTAKLPELFRARSAELRSQVMVDDAGVTRMRPAAREALAQRLDPIAAASPLMADRLEALAVRRIEFLASKLPRRPEVAGIDQGPDTWQPSDMEMRAWARYVSGVEDPGAIEERLAEGSVTPEDAEVMREVYPERLADITRQILERLPTLQRKLPYERRLALSLLTGVAVDPALDPKVLGVLQRSFDLEEGTDQGTHAPKPQPAFGSVKADAFTPAQERGAL